MGDKLYHIGCCMNVILLKHVPNCFVSKLIYNYTLRIQVTSVLLVALMEEKAKSSENREFGTLR